MRGGCDPLLHEASKNKQTKSMTGEKRFTLI